MITNWGQAESYAYWTTFTVAFLANRFGLEGRCPSLPHPAGGSTRWIDFGASPNGEKYGFRLAETSEM